MGNSSPWHVLYGTTRWQALRKATFLRDLYTCRKCARLVGDSSKLVCDHIKPHRGDERLFWDDTNLQTLCKPCHDKAKQIEEQQTKHMRGVWH
jgi:5-methylcytosine-specific restriction protein A